MDEPLVSVAGLHAIVYCERLFYLEEVERIRLADVYSRCEPRIELGRDEGEEAASRRAISSNLLPIIDRCPRCASRAIAKNHVDDWSHEPAPFRLVGSPSDQGSVGRPSDQGSDDGDPNEHRSRRKRP